MLLDYIRAHNIVPKLVSLALATGVWFIAHNQKSEQSTIYIPVLKPVMPKGFALSKDWKPPLVKVEFNGADWESSVVRKDWRLLPKVIGKAKPGKNVFRLTINRKLPAGQYINILPPSISVDLSPALTKWVEVRPDIKLEDHQVETSTNVTPDRVQIRGPIQHIEKIKFIYTAKIEAPEGVGKIDKKVKLLPSSDIIEFTGKGQTEVRVQANIVDERNFVVRKIKNVFIEAVNLSPGLEVKIVPVKTDVEVLIPKQSVDEFDEDDIRVQVNLSKFYRKGDSILPSDKPEGVPITVLPTQKTKNIILSKKTPEEVSLILRLKES